MSPFYLIIIRKRGCVNIKVSVKEMERMLFSLPLIVRIKMTNYLLTFNRGFCIFYRSHIYDIDARKETNRLIGNQLIIYYQTVPTNHDEGKLKQIKVANNGTEV